MRQTILKSLTDEWGEVGLQMSQKVEFYGAAGKPQWRKPAVKRGGNVWVWKGWCHIRHTDKGEVKRCAAEEIQVGISEEDYFPSRAVTLNIASKRSTVLALFLWNNVRKCLLLNKAGKGTMKLLSLNRKNILCFDQFSDLCVAVPVCRLSTNFIVQSVGRSGKSNKICNRTLQRESMPSITDKPVRVLQHQYFSTYLLVLTQSLCSVLPKYSPPLWKCCEALHCCCFCILAASFTEAFLFMLGIVDKVAMDV